MTRYSEAEYAKLQMRHGAIVTCAACKAVVPRVGAGQLYCVPCSEKRDLDRKRLWAREHPQIKNPETRDRRLQKQIAQGVATSAQAKERYGFSEQPDLAWMVRVNVPFTYAASKNHLFAMIGRGHIALRKESRAIRNSLRDALGLALIGQKIVHNKVWLGIYVEKPNHKGDAVNVIDLVCDAAKEACGVDDRWFCIRKVDWQIAKTNPRLFVDIGQEVGIVDSQACSYCGRIMPLETFGLSKHNKRGRHRICRDCSTTTGKQVAAD